MKILIISHEYPPIGGGGANACFFLAREFARMGHQVAIITARFKNCPEKETTSDGVLIYRVKCRRANREKSSLPEMFSYLLSAWKAAVQIAENGRYDTCLVFFGIPSGPIALHLKFKYHMPYIVRFGGGDIPGAQKRFRLVYTILSPFIRNIWKNADYLVANSEGLCLRAQKFEYRYRIDIIENGVDSQFFVPGGIPRNNDEVRILFVSRLIEGKGLQFLIPKMNSIQEKVYQKTGKKVRLVIVGDGPYRQALESMVRETSTGGCVQFEGRRDREEVRLYYQNADVFVLPSLSEGMPNVVLEAMACGLPIVMTPCEGSRELVTDNGYVSTIEEFPRSLVRLCTDSDLRLRMGRNSLHRIKEHFQWEYIAMRYMEILGETIHERQTS
ncbi:hypothetical protein C804_06321 [Lachnospiraceae bacterium A4]|nr:hypothetical protein C804_06321 [Lachnospiraceae bacterium A4]